MQFSGKDSQNIWFSPLSSGLVPPPPPPPNKEIPRRVNEQLCVIVFISLYLSLSVHIWFNRSHRSYSSIPTSLFEPSSSRITRTASGPLRTSIRIVSIASFHKNKTWRVCLSWSEVDIAYIWNHRESNLMSIWRREKSSRTTFTFAFAFYSVNKSQGSVYATKSDKSETVTYVKTSSNKSTKESSW